MMHDPTAMSDTELMRALDLAPDTSRGVGCLVVIKFHPECDPDPESENYCGEAWTKEGWLLTAEEAALFVVETLNGWCVDDDFYIEVNGRHIYT